VSRGACALSVCVLFTFAIREACPEGALCPGGSRLRTRPGYWAPTDGGANGGSGGAGTAVVACRLPNATARCLGWNVHDGATRCGAGYVPESYRLLLLASGAISTRAMARVPYRMPEILYYMGEVLCGSAGYSLGNSRCYCLRFSNRSCNVVVSG